MTRRSPTDKFVGTTDKCFAHLFKGRRRQERLALYRLIGDFCTVNTQAVSEWQRGIRAIRGASLARLRCFLHLAGYEVAEVDGYHEPVRSLLLIVGLQIPDDPYKLEHDLGYEASHLKSLYGVILRNEGYSEDVRRNIERLRAQHKQELSQKMDSWRVKIKEALKDLAAVPKKTTSSVPSASSGPVDPHMVASFAHSIRLTLSLGQTLVTNPVAAQAVREATRNGLDLRELQDLLKNLLD
jgi:hypothetical protein